MYDKSKPSEFARHGRSSRLPPSRLPGPETSEAHSMPADNRLRLDDHQDLPPTRPQPRQDDPEKAIGQLNELLALGTLSVSLENSNDEEILAQHRNDGTSFSIAQLSDGERNAAIIAARLAGRRRSTWRCRSGCTSPPPVRPRGRSRRRSRTSFRARFRAAPARRRYS